MKIFLKRTNSIFAAGNIATGLYLVNCGTKGGSLISSRAVPRATSFSLIIHLFGRAKMMTLKHTIS
jgi:hypothetical protein